MPGVAGAGVAGETRAGLLAGLRAAACGTAGALRVVGAVATACVGAEVATVVGDTATVRCDMTQRSGSSGHPPLANAEPADTAHAVITAMARNG